MVQWQGQRAKVQLRLANQRLRLLQEKKLALAKQTRRDIADLLVKNRVETARLRVETLISEDIQVELLELVELYSETLLARFAVLEQSTEDPEGAVADAVAAIVYAAPHVELRELQVVREMLMNKFGRPFAISIMSNTPPRVPPRILSKLAVYVPPPELVDAYLEEIARGYNVQWEAPKRVEVSKEESGDEDEGSDEDGGTKAAADAQPNPALPAEPGKQEATAEKSSPPKPSEGAVPPPKAASPPSTAADKPVDEVEALLARFSALKKR